MLWYRMKKKMPNQYTYKKGEIPPSKTKEYRTNYQRNWRRKNPERARKIAKKYRSKEEVRKRLNASYKKYRDALRLSALVHYSNKELICKCCGEKYMEFLTIDHIKGGGTKHRKSIRKDLSASQFYLWLKRNNYPKGFQVLCMNCNFAKAHGGCPHNERKNQIGI